MSPPDAPLTLSFLSAPPPAPHPARTLAETVDHLIARGIVVQGQVALAVAGTELVRLDLSAVLRAVVPPSARYPDPDGPVVGGDAKG